MVGMSFEKAPVLVTGGAGFIGANFVLDWFETVGTPLVNLDKLTYAGNPLTLESLKENPNYTFVHGDICAAGCAARGRALAAGVLRTYPRQRLIRRVTRFESTEVRDG